MARNGASGVPRDANPRDELNRLRAEVQALRKEIAFLRQREAGPDTLQTVVFDDEAEYVRFTDYVYDNFSGRGVELTNVPVAMSIRVHSWLLNALGEQFAMRLVTKEDVMRARDRVKGRRPFDPDSLVDFHVPGAAAREEPR